MCLHLPICRLNSEGEASVLDYNAQVMLLLCAQCKLNIGMQKGESAWVFTCMIIFAYSAIFNISAHDVVHNFQIFLTLPNIETLTFVFLQVVISLDVIFSRFKT